MKKITMLVLSLCLGFAVGCNKVDTSAATPPAAPEETTQELQKAADAGQINPDTYGQPSAPSEGGN